MHNQDKDDSNNKQKSLYDGPSLREIAKSLDLPIEVVGRLQDLDVISAPVTGEDIVFMEKYRKTWGNTFLIRKQLANMSKKRRESILTRPELATKWERWVYYRFLYNEIKYGYGGAMLNPKDRIRIDYIADDVEGIFRVPKSQVVLERIRKIREMAYNDRKKIYRDPHCEREILLKRTNMKSKLDLELESYVFDWYS